MIIKHKKQNKSLATYQEIEGQNILFVYSCSQDTLFLYQHIALISQMVELLKSKNKIFLLSTFENLKFAIEDDVECITDKINQTTILETIKKYNIDLIVPFEIEKKLINRIIAKTKIINFFQSYFENKEKLSFLTGLAKNTGWYIKNHLSKEDKQKYRAINVSAIKDIFGNQIVLDTFESSVINNKKLFCNYLCLDANIKKQIKILLKHFGNQLQIINYPYNIKIFINDNNDIFFDGIEYGFCEEVIFAIQNQKINICNIILDIYEHKPTFLKKNYKLISYAYNYQQMMNIDYSFNISKYSNKKYDINNYVIQENEHLLYLIKQKKDNLSIFIKNKEKINILQKKQISDNNEYIIAMICDNYILESSNNILFSKICNKIHNQTNKPIILLTTKITPILNIINYDILIHKDIFEEEDLVAILKIYNITSAYITPTALTNDLIKVIDEHKIKLYCQHSKDNNFALLKDEKYIISLCNNINLLYQKNIFDKNEKIFKFCCITDKHKNIILPTIVNEIFTGEINNKLFLYPPKFDNYDIKEDIMKNVEKLVENITSYGLLNIDFIYKQGDIYLKSIDIQNNTLLFNMNVTKDNQTLYDILLKALLGENIDLFSRQNIKIKTPKFYQKILFENINKQYLVLDDLTTEKVIQKYKTIVC